MEKETKASADTPIIEIEKYRKIVGKYFNSHMDMADYVYSFWSNNSKEIDTIAQATRFFNLFNVERLEVIKYINIGEKPLKSIVAEKQKAHEELILFSEYMCKNMTALGTSYNIEDLLKTIKISDSKLKFLNQDKLVLFVNTALQKSKQYIKQLAEFGITQKQIDEYKVKIEIYENLIYQCEAAAKSHSERQTMKYRSFARMMNYLEKLDVIMQGAIFSKQQLVEDYVKARKVRHMPVHKTALKFNITDYDTNEPIYHATYFVKKRKIGGTETASKPKKTTALGNGQEKTLAEDGYILFIEKPDYESLQVDFATETGKTVFLEIKLKKIKKNKQ